MMLAWFQRIANDGVLIGQQRFEQAAVRIEAGGVEDRVFGAEESTDFFFELFMDCLRAADEAY